MEDLEWLLDTLRLSLCEEEEMQQSRQGVVKGRCLVSDDTTVTAGCAS